MTKIDNIKYLYKEKIQKKTACIKIVAEDLGLNPQYVRGHYFSAFWSIPEHNQDRIIELLQNIIAQQNKVA